MIEAKAARTANPDLPKAAVPLHGRTASRSPAALYPLLLSDLLACLQRVWQRPETEKTGADALSSDKEVDRVDRDRVERQPDPQPRPENIHIVRQTGERGGYAPTAGAVPTVFTIQEVRWGAVWAGVLVAITVFMILAGLGAGVGLYGATGAPVGGTGTFWWFIWIFVALFTGGWVASRLAGARDTSAGIWNGTLVWALLWSLALVVLEVGVGLAGVVAAGLNAGAGSATAAGASPSSIQSYYNIGGWALFAGIIIAWFFAIAGGWLGKRSEDAAHTHEVAQ